MKAHTDQQAAAGISRNPGQPAGQLQQQQQCEGLQSPGSSVSPASPGLSLSVPTEANRKIFAGANLPQTCMHPHMHAARMPYPHSNSLILSIWSRLVSACCVWVQSQQFSTATKLPAPMMLDQYYISIQSLWCTLCAAEQKAVTTPIKVAIPTEVNRKAFPNSPGGLISPGDNSTVYEPDRYLAQCCTNTNPRPFTPPFLSLIAELDRFALLLEHWQSQGTCISCQ